MLGADRHTDESALNKWFHQSELQNVIVFGEKDFMQLLAGTDLDEFQTQYKAYQAKRMQERASEKSGVGFDDAYYADMKASIDDATWWAKYMGKPYVREGLLFPADELRYFNGVLPDGEPDRKLMVMDIAWGGGDFTACPIAYVYGDAVFIPDLVFNNGDKTVTRPEVVGKIIQHKINVVRGEANNGGDEYCDVVDSQLRQQGYHCSVRSQRAPSGQSKLSRIIQYAPDIKRFYFLDEKHQSKEYKAFMEQVTMFTQLGKIPHDDAPDSLAQLADELYNGISKIEPVKRPF